MQPTLPGDDRPPIDRTLPPTLIEGLGTDRPPAPDPAGGRFGRYEDVREINRGGMGVILLGFDPNTAREVAIKILGHEATRSRRLGQKFLLEGRVTAQLEHPNIVPIYEVGLTDLGNLYYVMKRVRGRSLTDVLEERPGPGLVRLLRDFLKVCDAVAYAHARRVVHRDLKPDNVMIGEFGEVLVLDWGLARVLDGPDEPAERAVQKSGDSPVDEAYGEADRTVDGTLMGTIPYMPPEQARGEIDRLDERADVYALGAILYQTLTGKVPFEGPSQVLLVQEVVAGRLVAPSERAPDRAIPAELEVVVLKAMSPRPADRYPSATALQADVEAWLEGRPLAALTYSPLARAAKAIGRHRALSSAVFAGLAVALAVTTWALVERQRARASAADARASAAEIARQAEAERTLHRALALRSAVDEELVLTVRLRQDLDQHWPILPRLVPVLTEWLDTADGLLGRLDDHRQAMAGLRSRATAVDPDGRPRFERPEDEAAYWRRVDLVDAIEFLGQRRPEVEGRLRRAVTLVRDAGEVLVLWRTAREAGLAIPIQDGLAPLGRDPDSGLWEFAVLGTGQIPERAPARAIVAEQGTAIVLVLLPGGRFLMGADRDGPPNRDPDAEPGERPVHEVGLDPFLISKFEMTRGQWRAIHDQQDDPNRHRPEIAIDDHVVDDLRHPVESVDWNQAREALLRVGLVLPTEAQWEYAARAGTSTVWWTGDDRESIAGAGNLADATARAEAFPGILRFEDWLDDGFAGHAPVGTYLPNAFGLHDTIGNVWEWCRDGRASYRVAPGPGDGLRRSEAEAERCLRGGSFRTTGAYARSADRFFNKPTSYRPSLGIRPARAVER